MRFLLIAGILINIIVANDVIITKTFTTSKEIEPRFLFANVRIESSSKLRNIGELKNSDREKITNTLNAIISKAESSKVCKGGSFSIAPIVSYEKDTRKTIGQNANFNLNCKFTKDEMSAYDKLLEGINDSVSQNELLFFPQPSINYRITDDEIENTKEELFDKFLGEIEQIEDKYGKILNKTCKANNVRYGENLQVSQVEFRAMKSSADSITANSFSASAAPIVDTSRITIDINMQLICK